MVKMLRDGEISCCLSPVSVDVCVQLTCKCERDLAPDTLTMSYTPACTSLTALTLSLSLFLSHFSLGVCLLSFLCFSLALSIHLCLTLSLSLALSFWPQEITLTPRGWMLSHQYTHTHTHILHPSICGPVYTLISSPGAPWLPLIHKAE